MITEGYLARHYQGLKGGREVALLDVVQDYALKIIDDRGLFGLGLTLKGGTAIRKYKVGTLGRFSTDLDFAADDGTLGTMLLSELDGASLHDVRFTVEIVTPGQRGRLKVATPLGSPNADALVEIKARTPWLAPQTLPPVSFPVHSAYEFRPVSIPVMVLEEILAEKLAAFRRRALVRDLYDLALFSKRPFNGDLVRRLTYLKVFIDVVVDGLGDGPFDPAADILRPRRTSDFREEDIGLLTGEVDIPSRIESVRTRFKFLLNASEEEGRWAQCNPRDTADVHRAIASLRVVD